MKFLVDAQLPPALKDWFRIHGYEARHVQDVGLLDAKMGPFGSMPLAGNAAIVTKDEDFADRSARDVNSPKIVWLRAGNTTNRMLLEWLTASVARSPQAAWRRTSLN